MTASQKRIAVSLLVVVVAGIGGVVVFNAGSAGHAQDRASITSWQSGAAASIAVLERFVAALPTDAAAATVEVARARAALLDQDAADFLRATIAEYVRAADALIAALQAIERGDRARADAQRAQASSSLRRARATLIEVRCRARIPDCETLPEPLAG